jgi:hypothetical protein
MDSVGLLSGILGTVFLFLYQRGVGGCTTPADRRQREKSSPRLWAYAVLGHALLGGGFGLQFLATSWGLRLLGALGL